MIILSRSFCYNVHIPLHAVYIDCKDAQQNGHNTSGVYTINPDNQTAFKVYCDMDTDGGGWTVIQRRFDGSVSFNRSWTECERGFGNKSGEYWLGLSYMHRLTTSAAQALRVDLTNIRNGSTYARYATFTVANATDKYRLLVSGYSGTAGDGLFYHLGQQFTTWDNDNDIDNNLNCAKYFRGPWWHRSCYSSFLNGPYGNQIYWLGSAMKDTSMKLRRK